MYTLFKFCIVIIINNNIPPVNHPDSPTDQRLIPYAVLISTIIISPSLAGNTCTVRPFKRYRLLHRGLICPSNLSYEWVEADIHSQNVAKGDLLNFVQYSTVFTDICGIHFLMYLEATNCCKCLFTSIYKNMQLPHRIKQLWR